MHETVKLKASRSDGFTSLVGCISICAADYPEEIQLRIAVVLDLCEDSLVYHSVPQELAFLCLTSLTMSSKLETTFTPPNSSLASLTAPSLHSPGLRIRRASIPADAAPWKSLEQA